VTTLADSQTRLTAVLRSRPLPGPKSVGGLLEGLAALPGAAVLESSALHEQWGRYSILAARPLAVIELRDDKLLDESGRCLARGPKEVWAALNEAFCRVRLRRSPEPSPGYAPGWIGYVGYEVGRLIERLPGKARRDTALPDLRLGFYDALLLHDAVEQTWRLVELAFDEPPLGAGVAAGTLRDLLRRAEGEPPPAPTEASDARKQGEPRTVSNFSSREYRDAVRRCVDYIAAGDIFQVNLSRRLELRPAPPPAEIYRCLRRRNPAWYSAFLQFRSGEKRCAVCSSSPELFLRCREGRVITRPIKGTRPRMGDAETDRAAAEELLASEKDNAELAMIIDLLRNDLGRVCRFGTVKVTQPRVLETHPTVFHLVGTIEGRLRAGVGPAELLHATFPGGSITGAPKIRAMEIIDELEGLARGVYTGCIGIVGVDGGSEWNIAIRTLVCEDDRAMVQVGGGIVADSTPRGEYDETSHKARALLEALQRARR
jgi:para-aminobenzoate synthetase component 1